jgi:outer membrane protein assembly factor BamB
MSRWEYIAMRICLTLLLLPAALAAGEGAVIGWRGNGQGFFPLATPPEGAIAPSVAWRVDLKSSSNASPIIVGDAVIVRAALDEVICLALADGKERWRGSCDTFQRIGDAARREDLRKRLASVDRFRGAISGKSPHDWPKDWSEEVRKEAQVAATDMKIFEREHGIRVSKWGQEGFHASTPVSDGTRIYVKSSTGVMSAWTLDGKRVWMSPFPQCRDGDAQEAMINSPLYADGKVFVLYAPDTSLTKMTHSHNESVLAFDAATGKELWRCQEWFRTPGWSCASPTFATVGSERVVVTAGGGVVRCRDGRTLAQEVIFSGSANTPTSDGDVVFCLDMASHGQNKPKERQNPPGWRLYARRLLPDGPDTVKVQEVWKVEKADGPRVFSSLLILDGRLFVWQGSSGRNRDLGIYDAATGKELAPKAGFPKGAECHYLYPSPVAGGTLLAWPENNGLLHFSRLTDPAKAVASWTYASPDGKPGHGNSMSASPALHGSQAVLRINQEVVCLNLDR